MSAPEPRPDAPAQPGSDDARPRPQYGEYATPEQQRAAIREPAPQAAAPTTQLPTPVTGPLPLPHPTSAARPSRTADRIITFALLVYGLITVISGVPQLWNFTELAQTTLDLAGIDATFSNFAQGDLWGRIGAIVFVVGWMLTAVLAWRAAARGRLSWWIPLVGAIGTFLVVTVCVMVPLYTDPAIVAYITR